MLRARPASALGTQPARTTGFPAARAPFTKFTAESCGFCRHTPARRAHRKAGGFLVHSFQASLFSTVLLECCRLSSRDQIKCFNGPRFLCWPGRILARPYSRSLKKEWALDTSGTLFAEIRGPQLTSSQLKMCENLLQEMSVSRD